MRKGNNEETILQENEVDNRGNKKKKIEKLNEKE